jgi:hypothetical protein
MPGKHATIKTQKQPEKEEEKGEGGRNNDNNNININQSVKYASTISRVPEYHIHPIPPSHNTISHVYQDMALRFFCLLLLLASPA